PEGRTGHLKQLEAQNEDQRPSSGSTGEVAEPEPAKTRMAERGQHASGSTLPEKCTTVSRILTATKIPDTAVSTATVMIAAGKPAASAMRPATTAPTAYPASRQSRQIPTDVALAGARAASPMT